MHVCKLEVCKSYNSLPKFPNERPQNLVPKVCSSTFFKMASPRPPFGKVEKALETGWGRRWNHPHPRPETEQKHFRLSETSQRRDLPKVPGELLYTRVLFCLPNVLSVTKESGQNVLFYFIFDIQHLVYRG